MRLIYLAWISTIVSSIVQKSAFVDAMTNQNLLVVVGLNGALQKRFVIQDHKDLIPGNVHRASQIQTGVGGKGQDVAIALNSLGTEGIRLLQFVGQGAEGDTVYQCLSDQLGAEAIQETTIRVQSLMRTCTSIVGASETTELVEPSGNIEAEEIQALLHKCERLQSTSGICIMGSMPPGCLPQLYSEIYQRITSQSSSKTLCVIDSVAGVDFLFQALTGPTIYKVNAQELCGLVGLPEKTNLSEIIPAFLNKYQPPQHLQGLAITDGKRPGYLCCFDSSKTKKWQLFSLEIPKLDESSCGTKAILYPIGAGDAVAAGTLAAWMTLETGGGTVPPSCRDALFQKFQSLQQNQISPAASTLVTSFAFGLACGSASKYQTTGESVEDPAFGN